MTEVMIGATVDATTTIDQGEIVTTEDMSVRTAIEAARLRKNPQ
jgi:hypothetical protein